MVPTDFISIKEIAGQLYSENWLSDLPFEQIANDTIELIRIIGCPACFEEKEAELDIHDWKALLPCDFYKLTQAILLSQNKMYFNTYKEATDTFSLEGSDNNRDLQYKIQGRIFWSTMKECCTRISYTAVKTDDEGFPMIADNAQFIRALKTYIKWNYAKQKFYEDPTNGNKAIKDDLETEYYMYAAQAQNSLIAPDLGLMESISAMMNSILARPIDFYNTFRDSNKHHTYKVH